MVFNSLGKVRVRGLNHPKYKERLKQYFTSRDPHHDISIICFPQVPTCDHLSRKIPHTQENCIVVVVVVVVVAAVAVAVAAVVVAVVVVVLCVCGCVFVVA